MDKLLLLSVLIAMVYFPMAAAKASDPKRALKLAVKRYFAFNIFYLIAVVFIYFFIIVGRDPMSVLSKSVHD